MGRLLQTIGAQQPDTAQIEKLREECKNYGITALTNPIKRSIISPQTTEITGTEITYERNPFYKISYDMEGIFKKSQVLRNLKNNTKIPVIDVDNVTWGDSGIIDGNVTMESSRILSPKVLSVWIDVSRELINQTDEFEEHLIEMVVLKFQEKLLKTIFSKNNGIIASPQSVVELTDYDSLVNFKYTCDFYNSTENSWIISPLAQKKINQMKDGNLINNGKLLSSDAFCLNSMTDGGDGYIVYCPLDSLVIAEWGVIDYTRDPYTQSANGKIRLVFRGYFDYDYVRPGLMRIGHFTETEDNSNTEDNSSTENNSNTEGNNDGEQQP